jgi:hypothetical protein
LRRSRLFSWVEVTVGAGTNGKPQPSNFSTEYSPAATTTGEGSTSLGFYNVQNGDAPYFKSLAEQYAMSDNFHQSVNGGTGANHIMLGHGDAIWFSDGAGKPLKPPHNVEVDSGSANAGIVDEIENPNAQPAPTTGTARTATAAAPTARRPTAAAPTATAPIRHSRASPRSSGTCNPCRVRSTRTARSDTTIC